MMRFYGLLGETLSHSISPEIHGFLFRQLNIEASYSLFPVPPDKLADALYGLRLLGSGGVNVTIPYKMKIIPLLDELTDEARALGAVNTVLFRNGRTIGYNTDYAGFGLMLKQHGIEAAGKTAVILGTGGAARTAACWLSDHGAANVKLVSRRPAGAGRFDILSYNDLTNLTHTDILVNATPVGMYPHIHETPLAKALLTRFGVIIDLIYNPLETRLMREGREQGIYAVNGLTMLAAQAVAAEEIWQGRSIAEELLEPVCEFLSDLPEHTHNLVFIGMPGSGKSTFGRLAADRLGWEFCDTDPYIEQRAGRSIPEIFRLEGEEAFRRLETEAIREFSRRRRVVIATGGGAVTRPENMALLEATGRLIYLDRPIEIIAASNLTGRPLLNGDKGKLYSLYEARKPLYERYAHCQVLNKYSLERVLDSIFEDLKRRSN
jgi:shikimate dehydrogenase